MERHIIGREVLWTYADARRGILRQRKKRHHQGAKQEARNGRIETRVGIEGMEICCWKERRNRQGERRQQQRANQEVGSKADRGNGWKDI